MINHCQLMTLITGHEPTRPATKLPVRLPPPRHRLTVSPGESLCNTYGDNSSNWTLSASRTRE